MKKKYSDFISGPVSPDLISDVFIEIAMSSEAKLSIIPMQDFMGLDSKRMNHPGTTSQNWKWQTDGEMFSDSLAAKILKKQLVWQGSIEVEPVLINCGY